MPQQTTSKEDRCGLAGMQGGSGRAEAADVEICDVLVAAAHTRDSDLKLGVVAVGA